MHTVLQPISTNQMQDNSSKAPAKQVSTGSSLSRSMGQATTSAPSTSAELLPVFDLGTYMNCRDVESSAVREFCESAAACLRDTGCLVVRDPRVTPSDSVQFLDLMERYFQQPLATKLADCRPSLAYQVGATPEGVELPLSAHDPTTREAITAQPALNRATLPPGPDCKWRFFWRIGDRPNVTRYKELNAEPVVPDAFPEWREIMDGWGNKMLAAVDMVAEVAARGFGLAPDAFTSRMHQGPHLLAPTGSDLAKYHELGTVYAGYHYDLNFLTIHGRSRFPGLFVWLRDGRRLPVAIPEGCLLLQAGKQLEWLTGGHVRAGMHEVVCTEGTQRALAEAQAAGRPTWRVSSTVFAHIASDELLQPLPRFATPAAVEQYPPTHAGEYVNRELEAIKLKA